MLINLTERRFAVWFAKLSRAALAFRIISRKEAPLFEFLSVPDEALMRLTQ